jgi:hypothetical protein
MPASNQTSSPQRLPLPIQSEVIYDLVEPSFWILARIESAHCQDKGILDYITGVFE